jgi:hypothetical protein
LNVSKQVRFGKSSCTAGYPPPPPPSESLDWRGFCKNALQNLERLGVRGQNLENKELAAFFAGTACTASALTMICSLSLRVKVRCHRGWVWKNLFGRPYERKVNVSPFASLRAGSNVAKGARSGWGHPAFGWERCRVVRARSFPSPEERLRSDDARWDKGPSRVRASFGAGARRRRWCRSGRRGACGSSRKMRCRREAHRIRVGAGILRRSFL